MFPKKSLTFYFQVVWRGEEIFVNILQWFFGDWRLIFSGIGNFSIFYDSRRFWRYLGTENHSKIDQDLHHKNDLKTIPNHCITHTDSKVGQKSFKNHSITHNHAKNIHYIIRQKSRKSFKNSSPKSPTAQNHSNIITESFENHPKILHHTKSIKNHAKTIEKNKQKHSIKINQKSLKSENSFKHHSITHNHSKTNQKSQAIGPKNHSKTIPSALQNQTKTVPSEPFKNQSKSIENREKSFKSHSITHTHSKINQESQTIGPKNHSKTTPSHKIIPKFLKVTQKTFKNHLKNHSKTNSITQNHQNTQKSCKKNKHAKCIQKPFPPHISSRITTKSFKNRSIAHNHLKILQKSFEDQEKLIQKPVHHTKLFENYSETIEKLLNKDSKISSFCLPKNFIIMT